jgi:uncharacterized protein YkwD
MWPAGAYRRFKLPGRWPACTLAGLILLQLSAATLTQAASDDALATARNLRWQGCAGHPGIRSVLHTSATLNSAAVQWSRGSSLKSAIERSGYRASESAGLHVSGTATTLRSALSNQLCAALTDSVILDIGTYRARADTWIVLGAPFAAPGPADADAVADEMLRLVNAARATPRRCGGSAFGATAPLRLNQQLSRAALAHAEDMLRFNYFEHTGHDGSSPAMRVAAEGYRYRIVGENIASGPESAQEAMQGWLLSPGHCQNIMDPRFQELGVAFAASRGGPPRIYWVQDLARALKQ